MNCPVPNIISTCKFQNVRFAYTHTRSKCAAKQSFSGDASGFTCMHFCVHFTSSKHLDNWQFTKFSNRIWVFPSFFSLDFLLHFTLVYVVHDNDVQRNALLELEWRWYEVAVKSDKTLWLKISMVTVLNAHNFNQRSLPDRIVWIQNPKNAQLFREKCAYSMVHIGHFVINWSHYKQIPILSTNIRSAHSSGIIFHFTAIAFAYQPNAANALSANKPNINFMDAIDIFFFLFRFGNSKQFASTDWWGTRRERDRGSEWVYITFTK